MADCLLSNRDLRTKHENMNSRTWVSSARSPSHSPQGETIKEGPRGDSQGWPRVQVTRQVCGDKAQMKSSWVISLLVRAWINGGMSVAELETSGAGAGTNSPG